MYALSHQIQCYTLTFHAVPSIINEEQFKRAFNLITTVYEINIEVLSNSLIAESVIINNASKRLDLIVSRLKTGKIHAGIIGLTKAGKSTTLNALLGNIYLPASIQPQTAEEVRIVHTTDVDGELYGVMGGKHNHLATGLQSIHDKLVELNEAARKHIQNGYKKLFLHAPLQFLVTDKIQGVQFELSDNPGLGEAASEHFSLASELAIRDMCAFVMILKLDFLKTKAEADLLMKLSTHHPKLFTNLNRILILVNAYELSYKDRSPHSLQASDIPVYVSDYLREPNVLGKNIPEEHIIPFSALWGLRARLWSADPDTLLNHYDARNLYNEAIIELDRAGYGHEVESLKAERNEENVRKLSHLLEDFSHITLVESNLTNMLYTHGAIVLMESSVDDTLSVAEDIFNEIMQTIKRDNCSKKEHFVQNARSILASYTSTVDKYINIVCELDHFIEFSTRATINTLADSLEESLNGIINNKLYEILQATIEHEEKKHVQSKIISTKSAILSPAANRMKMEWIKVTDFIHKSLSERVKVILSELRVELVSSFSDEASQSGLIDEETIKHFNKVATKTSERLTGLQDTALGFISSSNTSSLQFKLTYKGDGSERVTDTALSERLIQGKKIKYNLKSDKVCIGRKYVIAGPKECVRINIAEPYDAVTYSPDFGSIQSDFGEVVKGWIKTFGAQVDMYRSRMSETVVIEFKSKVETALSFPIQQLEDDLHMKEDAFEQAKVNIEFLNSMITELNKAKKNLEEFIDKLNA